jgi:hypothetical protein
MNDTPLHRILTLPATALLATVLLAGCDTDEPTDPNPGTDTTYNDGDTILDGDGDSGVLTDTIGGALADAGISPTQIRTKLDELTAGDGTMAEKAEKVIEHGRETFSSLGDSVESAEGGESVSNFFGTLNNSFGELKESVEGGNMAAAGASLKGLTEMDVPDAAKPYVQPYMDKLSSLMGGEMGDTVRRGLQGLTGGDNDGDIGSDPEEFTPPS